MNSEAALINGFVILEIAGLLFLAGCGGGTASTLISNPTPTIAAISPSSVAAGGAAFILTVNGTNFVPASAVNFGGTAAATTFVSAMQLIATISASAIASPGNAAVTVTNDAPGGGTSNSVNFTITSTITGLGPVSVAIAPDPTNKLGKFAYVANSKANSVSMYTIDALTGGLTLIGRIAAGTSPGSVAVDPFGKFAYVANQGNGPGTASVSMYTIDGTTGALTLAGAESESCPELCTASSVFVHPTGQFAYVGDAYPGENVSMFSIDLNTGALTFRGTVGAASPNGSNAMAIAIDPSGKFAYAVGDNCALDTFDGEVSAYTISPSTGALSSTGSPAAAGVCPSSVAVDHLGRFAYVTNDSGLNGHQDDDVATYTINATTGALTFIGFAGTGMGPSFVAIDPTGKFAYVTNFLSNDVSVYTINAITGALTSIGTVGAGASPTSIAIDPSGKFAYVTNSGSGDVSMYSIDPTTGGLTLIGTVGT